MRDRTFPHIEHRVFRVGDQYTWLSFLARTMSQDQIDDQVAAEVVAHHPDAVPVRWKDIPRDIRDEMEKSALTVLKTEDKKAAR